MRNARQRLTLTDLKEPQQVRELNRQLTWVWDRLLGGLELKALTPKARAVIDSKASGEEMESRFTQTEERITSEVTRATGTEAELRTLIDQNAEDIRIWADSPAKGVDNGSGVVITQAGVSVSGDQYVNMEAGDGKGYLKISSGGVDASSLTAPNVTPRYDGPGTLYVSANPTSEQVEAGTHFRGLADAAGRLNGKWLDGDVEIIVEAGFEESGEIVFRGLAGGGKLVVSGNAASPMKINTGRLAFEDARVRAEIAHIAIWSAGEGMAFGGGVCAEVRNCSVNGAAASAGSGIVARDGAAVYADGCEVYDFAHGLRAESLGRIHSQGNRGDSPLATSGGGIITANGTQPSDTSAMNALDDPPGTILLGNDVAVDQGSQPSAPTAPTTESFAMEHSDSWADSWVWTGNDDVYQGYVNANGRWQRARGCMWFPSALRTRLAGKTIQQATIRLYQDGSVGRGVAVTAGLGGTDAAWSSHTEGAPAITRDYGPIGVTEPGRITTLTIPVQAVQDLADGTIEALMTLSGDSEGYKGQGYSRNYTRYWGQTRGSADTYPVLTVTYV